MLEPVLEGLRARLQAAVDPEFRDGQRAFFKEEVDNYGVRGPELKAIARGQYRDVKKWFRGGPEPPVHGGFGGAAGSKRAGWYVTYTAGSRRNAGRRNSECSNDGSTVT